MLLKSRLHAASHNDVILGLRTTVRTKTKFICFFRIVKFIDAADYIYFTISDKILISHVSDAVAMANKFDSSIISLSRSTIKRLNFI